MIDHVVSAQRCLLGQLAGDALGSLAELLSVRLLHHHFGRASLKSKSGQSGQPSHDADSPLGIIGAGFGLNQVAEWAMQDGALTLPNLICQQSNVLFAIGIANAIQSGCERKEPSANYVHQQGWVMIAF